MGPPGVSAPHPQRMKLTDHRPAPAPPFPSRQRRERDPGKAQPDEERGATMRKQMEGDNQRRRALARQARERGRQPSEVGASLSASKQIASLDRHERAGPAPANRHKSDVRGGPAPPQPGVPAPGAPVPVAPGAPPPPGVPPGPLPPP